MRLDRLTPLQLAAPASALEDLQSRLAAFRPPRQSTVTGWRMGVDLAYLEDLVGYWRRGFDWRAAEAELNRQERYTAPVRAGGGEIRLHLTVDRAARPDAPVVVVIPGWPSSLLEYRQVARRLARPEAYGGAAEQAVTVLGVELPGFGLSQAPAAPMTPRDMAKLLRELFVEQLELKRAVVHGADWGAVAASWLAADHPEIVQGLHLSMLGLRPGDLKSPPLDDAEKAWLGETRARLEADRGYAEVQGTRPNTAAVGLRDSPAALAAWMIEKYHGWSGAGPDAPPPLARDELLTAVSLYWLFGDLAAANWVYWADRNLGGIALAAGQRVVTPTGFAFFEGGFFPVPPRSWAERAYNVRSWDVFPDGGHFAAWLRPEHVAESLGAFAAQSS